MNNPALHLIVYISKSRIEAQNLQSEIDAICDVALRENLKRNITGILFHENGYFVQALEGDESQLRMLLANIEKDPRNMQLQIVIDESVVRRIFPDWAMRGLALADNTLFNPDTIAYLKSVYEQNVKINDASFVLFLENLINDLNFHQLFA